MSQEITNEEKSEQNRVSLDKVNKIVKFCQSIGLSVITSDFNNNVYVKRGRHKDKKVSKTILKLEFEEILNPNFIDEDAKYSYDD